jgi:hypothetical protein
MAARLDLSSASLFSGASCPDGWVTELSQEKIGFLQLYDDQWLDLGRDTVMSVLRAAYSLIAELSHGL